MIKKIASFCLIVFVMFTADAANARTNSKKKKKKSRSYASTRTYKVSKNSRHSRKSRRFHHGTGPDLKSITTDSPYKEDPNNGVNAIETKQPEL